MFLYRVEVRVATNPKVGLGLFAKEFISKNSIVWKFIEDVDTKISLDRFNEFNDAQKEFFYKYGWIEKGQENFYYCSGDLSNFLNHSYFPNLTGKQEYTVALKDIQPNEELFIDYSEFCFNFCEDEVRE